VSTPPRPPPPPSPERDRALARKPRLYPRKAEGIDQLVKGFLSSEDVRRMKRFAKVRGALDTVLGERERVKVTPISIQEGVLTVEVADSVLLGELRNHRAAALLAALAEAGTSVVRINWRIARRR
jgi:hypothetical protein